MDESGIPSLAMVFIHGDPNNYRTYKKLITSQEGVVGEWAQNDCRRTAFDRAFKKGGMEGFREYLEREAPRCDNSFDCQFTGVFYQHIEELASIPRRTNPQSDINVFFEFILSKADYKATDTEMLMWVSVACLEGVMTRIGIPALHFKDAFIGEMVPLNVWVPESNKDGLLSTTRYRVIDHILKNYMHSKNNSALQNLRGSPRFKTRENCDTLKPLNRSRVKLGLSNGIYRTDNLDLILDVMLHFAALFEWMQLSLFLDGVSADEIVKEFSKFPSIREDFYHELQYFYKKRISRKLYNHHV